MLNTMVSQERIAKGMYWQRSWSLVGGCTPVSTGCENCWACAEAHMRAGQSNKKIKARYAGLTTPGGKWNGSIRLHTDRFRIPLQVKKPTVWVVWNDLFNEAVTDNFIRQAFWTMKGAPQHIFLILTKRPGRMAELLNLWDWNLRDGAYDRRPLPNVWLGISAENQATADERIPLLLQTPAAVRFVSCEPLLGQIDLDMVVCECNQHYAEGCYNTLTGEWWPALGDADKEYDEHIKDLPKLNLVIAGGETGSSARPCHPNWVRSLRDQCQAAGVPFWFKSWGEWRRALPPHDEIWDGNPPKMRPEHGTYFIRLGKKQAGRLLDGREWSEFLE